MAVVAAAVAAVAVAVGLTVMSSFVANSNRNHIRATNREDLTGSGISKLMHTLYTK